MQIKLIHKHMARQVPAVATQRADWAQRPLDGLTWDKLSLYYIIIIIIIIIIIVINHQWQVLVYSQLSWDKKI